MKRREQNLDQRLEVTLELKQATAVHEEVRHKKKVINKQVNRLEATFGRTRLFEEIS